MNKSDKFRELLEREKYLKAQLDDCETAQSRMLNKAFKGLGMKLSSIVDLITRKADVAIIEIADCSVTYSRRTGSDIETCEISFEDLFDAEVQE